MNEPDLTPPGYWGESSENIHIVENFLTDEEFTTLLTYAQSIKEWMKLDDNWNDRVHNFGMIERCGRQTADYFRSITDRISGVISETMGVGLSSVVPSIVRWRIGDGQNPHADKQEIDGSPNPYPENDIASLVYINDHYEGGEIYFPNQKLKFKPAAKSLVFFPGDVNYLHGVTEVTDGVRYTMPNFWKVLDVKHRFD